MTLKFKIVRSKSDQVSTRFLQDYRDCDIVIVEYKGAFFAVTKPAIEAFASHHAINKQLSEYNPRRVWHKSETMEIHQFFPISKEIVYGSFSISEEALNTVEYIR